MAGENIIPTPSPSLNPFFIGAVPIFPQNFATYADKLKQSSHKTTTPFLEDKVITRSIETKLTLLSKGSLQLKPLASHLGKRSVIFQKSDKAKLIARLNYVIIAKFSHGRPAIDSVHQFLLQSKIKGDYVMSVFDLKHIFIEFVLYEDFSRIWLKKSWSIKGFPVRFFKWSDDFMSSKESSIVPVWVHLPRLPLYLYEEESLLSIANAIGKPLHIDKNNLNRTKLGYASFCVEMDVSKPPLDALWIEFQDECPSVRPDVFCQTIVYGDLPRFCVDCQHLGHKVEDCKRRVEENSASCLAVRDAGTTIKGPVDHVSEGVDHDWVEKGDHTTHVQLIGDVKASKGNEGLLLRVEPEHLPATGLHAPMSAVWDNNIGEFTATSSSAAGESSAEEESAFSAGTITEGELSRDDAGTIPEELGVRLSTTELVMEVPSVTHEAPETGSAVPFALVPAGPNSAGLLDGKIAELQESDKASVEGAAGEGAAAAGVTKTPRLTDVESTAAEGNNVVGEPAEGAGAAEAAALQAKETVTAGILLGKTVGCLKGVKQLEGMLVKSLRIGAVPDCAAKDESTLYNDKNGAAENDEGYHTAAALEFQGVLAARSQDTAGEETAEKLLDAGYQVTAGEELVKSAGNAAGLVLLAGALNGAETMTHTGADKGFKTEDSDTSCDAQAASEPGITTAEKHAKGAAETGTCTRRWADLAEEELEQQRARELKAIRDLDITQVKAYALKQIDEIMQEIGPTESYIRDSVKEEEKKEQISIISQLSMSEVVGEAERVRKSTAQEEKQLARELKFVRERKNLKEYFMASAEKINSDLKR